MSLSLCFVLSVCCGCQSCCHVVSVIGVISFFSVPLVSPARLVSPSPSLCVPRSPSLCLCISLFVSWVCDVLPCLFMHCPNVKFTHPGFQCAGHFLFYFVSPSSHVHCIQFCFPCLTMPDLSLLCSNVSPFWCELPFIPSWNISSSLSLFQVLHSMFLLLVLPSLVFLLVKV